jgi:hypothetical protein
VRPYTTILCFETNMESEARPPMGPLGIKGSTMASYVHLPPAIPLHLTNPLEQFKFGSFSMTTLKPVEQETKEHCASKLVNIVLEPR